MNYYTINSFIGNIGEVYEKDECKIEFIIPQLQFDIVKNVKPGCGCTQASVNYKKDKTFSIVAIFDVGTIPHHLKELDKQDFKKRIFLKMKSGDEHTLEFHGTRIRRK